jgi:hypothetical protein
MRSFGAHIFEHSEMMRERSDGISPEKMAGAAGFEPATPCR